MGTIMSSWYRGHAPRCEHRLALDLAGLGPKIAAGGVIWKCWSYQDERHSAFLHIEPAGFSIKYGDAAGRSVAREFAYWRASAGTLMVCQPCCTMAPMPVLPALPEAALSITAYTARSAPARQGKQDRAASQPYRPERKRPGQLPAAPQGHAQADLSPARGRIRPLRYAWLGARDGLTHTLMGGVLSKCNKVREQKLLNHLVGAGEQRRRDCQTQDFGRGHVDHQLQFRRKFHRQIARPRSP